jgi:hypothetical protein
VRSHRWIAQGGPEDGALSVTPPDTALRERLRGLAVERRRFGYRRLFVLLRREGELSPLLRLIGFQRLDRQLELVGLAF